jgi:hypothetical protein
MEEIEMLKQMGVSLDDPDMDRAMSHARKALKDEVARLAPSPRLWSVKPNTPFWLRRSQPPR